MAERAGPTLAGPTPLHHQMSAAQHDESVRLLQSIVPSHTTEDTTTYQATAVATISSPVVVSAPPSGTDPDTTAVGSAVDALEVLLNGRYTVIAMHRERPS